MRAGGRIRRHDLNLRGADTCRSPTSSPRWAASSRWRGSWASARARRRAAPRRSLPAILGGFKKQAQAQPTGLEGLGGLLGQLGGGGLLDDVLSPQPTDVSRGNDVLGQIFGSKDVSRTVAQNAASQSGLDPALLKKMLPMLAMLVAGYMAKQQGARRRGQALRRRAAGSAACSGGLLGGQAGGAGAAAGVAGGSPRCST